MSRFFCIFAVFSHPKTRKEKYMAKIEEKMLQMVVNNYNFFMLSVPRTRAYVDSSVSTYFFNQENLQKCHFLS